MKSTIKILLAVFALFICAEAATAQVPQMFNYQGIARDAKGNPFSSQKMALKISVLPAADATVPEYEETQIVNTNEFGLYTLQIGNGTAVTGEMKTVKWETGNKYIKVAIDPTGGNNYVDAGTNQLLSVPYAIYADKAGTATNGEHDKTRTGTVSSNAAHVAGDANYISKFTALNTIGKSMIYDNGTNLGVGTTSPVAKLHISQNVAAVQEHIRMQNLSSTGAGRFTMYNDAPTAGYANFTKYGTAYPGGYAGIATMYPYANLLAFGNNGVVNGDGLGRFLLTSSGNVGLSLYKSGLSKLKFHADFTTENVGIGGNAAPVSRVHLNNTDGNDMTVSVTNNTSGHTATDGLVIRENGNTASIINKENSTFVLGTNNTAKLFVSNSAKHMIGIGTLPNNNLSIYSGGVGDTVGIGLYNGSDLYNISMNGDGQLQFGANNDVLSGSTPILTLDDNGAGATVSQNLTVDGRAGIGTASPVAKLHVISEAAKDTAVFATTSSGSNQQVGLFGTYNTSGYGTGIVGRGFGGSVPPSTVDIGVYGSSTGVAVWSAGTLRVSGSNEAVGKTLVCNSASGNATWSGAIGFAATGSGNIAAGAISNRIYGTEEYDDGNGYNPATGIFTAPQDGVYHFNVEEGYSAAPGSATQLHISFMVNGSFSSGNYQNAITTTFWGISYARDLKLVAGDQVQVRIYNSTSGIISPSGTATIFTGHKVR